MSRFEKEINFLKSNFSEFKNIKTNKMKGMLEPKKVKSYDSNEKIIDLPPLNSSVVKKKDIYKCIRDRRRTRFYIEKQVSFEELSYFFMGNTRYNKNKQGRITVPCSGATHSFETYLFIMNVEGLEKGIYRYLPVEHKLLLINAISDVEEKLDTITLKQPFVPNFSKKAALTFAWSTTPYRSEWKYDISAHKKY